MRSDPRHQGSAPGHEAATVRDDSYLDNEQEHHHDESTLSHDESSAIIMLGSFVAGAIVGAIICVRVFMFAPIVVVLLCGAGAALFTKSDSKAGQISRGVGKWTSDVFLTLFSVVREFNYKYQLTDKVKIAAQEATGKAKAEVQRLGICDGVKTRARSLWEQVDKRTAPAGQPPIHAAQGQDMMGLMMEERQLGFDDAADALESRSCSSSSSEDEKTVPLKLVDA
ncbi:unnamed protein product [Ectocarpus sp. 12 AP-2014]